MLYHVALIHSFIPFSFESTWESNILDRPRFSYSCCLEAVVHTSACSQHVPECGRCGSLLNQSPLDGCVDSSSFCNQCLWYYANVKMPNRRRPLGLIKCIEFRCWKLASFKNQSNPYILHMTKRCPEKSGDLPKVT